MAGVSLLSEAVSPVSIRDVKEVKSVVSAIRHGNSKLSTKAQHAYDITDKRTAKVVKTGISGGKIRKDGKSYRAESQVRKWNKEVGDDVYESKITYNEPSGSNARQNILEYENGRSNELRDKGELNDPTKHSRP